MKNKIFEKTLKIMRALIIFLVSLWLFSCVKRSNSTSSGSPLSLNPNAIYNLELDWYSSNANLDTTQIWYSLNNGTHIMFCPKKNNLSWIPVGISGNSWSSASVMLSNVAYGTTVQIGYGSPITLGITEHCANCNHGTLTVGNLWIAGPPISTLTFTVN